MADERRVNTRNGIADNSRVGTRRGIVGRGVGAGRCTAGGNVADTRVGNERSIGTGQCALNLLVEFF
jgi:hypothetical protein